jgi:hypothetical protein
MAEVLAQFSDPLRTSDGSTYVAQACGGPNQQGLWEGWIEFVPLNGVSRSFVARDRSPAGPTPSAGLAG